MKWLETFKIAIIEKNIKQIDKQIDKIPKFETMEEMKIASTLIQEASKLLESEKNDLKLKMKKIKKGQSFFYTEQNIRKLDIQY